MKSKFEEYIANNRNEFDNKAVPTKSWDTIVQKLEAIEQKKSDHLVVRKSIRKFSLSIAASIIFLLTVGAFGGIFLSKTYNNKSAIASKIDPDYNDTENFYIRKVGYKLNELSKYNQDEDIKADLNQIDQFILELKEELQNAPKGGREKIIKNMIVNYQLKLEILDKVLQHVQASPENLSNQKNLENEKINL